MRVFTLPGLDGVPVYTVLSFFISEIRKNSLAVRAKSIAYSFFSIHVSGIAIHLHINPVYVLILLNMQNIDAYILKLIKDVSPSPEIFKFLKSFIQPFLI
jgi:membrane protein